MITALVRGRGLPLPWRLSRASGAHARRLRAGSHYFDVPVPRLEGTAAAQAAPVHGVQRAVDAAAARLRWPLGVTQEVLFRTWYMRRPL